MSIFEKENKKKAIAVLEIASDSVGGIIFLQDKEGKPEIVSTVRIPINFLFDVDFEAFWRCSKDALIKVIKKMLKDYPRGPDTCLCVLLSPWFLSETKIISIQKKEPFRITKEFFKELLKEEDSNLKKKWNLNEKLSENAPVIIENEVMRTELNGYPVDSVFGKKARTVKAHIYASLGMKKIVKEVEKKVLENFGDIPLSFRTMPAVLFKVLRSVINTSDGFITVDIGGEITDIIVVKNDSLEEVASFPIGRNSLIKKISSKFNTFPKEASSLLRAYFNDHLSKENKLKMFEILKEAEIEWCDFFKKAVRQISKGNALPQDVFLIGDETFSGQLLKCTENENFSGLTILFHHLFL